MYVVLLTTSGVFLGTKTVTNIDPLPPPPPSRRRGDVI